MRVLPIVVFPPMPPPVASLDDAEGTAAGVPAGTSAPASALPDIPIARPALHDEVTARLRDLIVENRIQPGERVPELEIAARLGVSRTPIREALKVLAAEGLVEMQPLRGAIVRGFSAKDAQDMLRVIALLEEFAGREACGAPAADIAAVQALHERMREHHRRRERQPYFALNQQIHQAIVALARNETLSAMHAQLGQRMRRIRYVGNSEPANWDAAMAEHEAMMQALAARDADAMAAAMRAHLLNTWPRIEQAAQPGAAVGDAY
jgi:DNA-binding GntR family transcriptional regulator